VERKECKVAVCHVVILGVEHKPRHDREVGVTEHHDCGQQTVPTIDAVD